MNSEQIMDELDLIARYFAPLAADGAFSLQDDAACYSCPPDKQLIVTHDALTENVHFLPTTEPADIAAKLFAVNLSDLAAKAAEPAACLLTFAPHKTVSPDWVAAFATETGRQLKQWDIALLGGDTIAMPQGSFFALTLWGVVAPNAMVRRAGAQMGDDVYVSGTIGKGWLGLRDAKQDIKQDVKENVKQNIKQNAPQNIKTKKTIYQCHYERPEPRLALGLALRPYIHAATDISDGLLADLTHICTASALGMTIQLEAIPFADKAPELRDFLITGGDDYELIFTAPPQNRASIEACATQIDIAISRIGQVIAGKEVVFLDAQGQQIKQQGQSPKYKGWQHFDN